MDVDEDGRRLNYILGTYRSTKIPTYEHIFFKYRQLEECDSTRFYEKFNVCCRKAKLSGYLTLWDI